MKNRLKLWRVGVGKPDHYLYYQMVVAAHSTRAREIAIEFAVNYDASYTPIKKNVSVELVGFAKQGTGEGTLYQLS